MNNTHWLSTGVILTWKLIFHGYIILLEFYGYFITHENTKWNFHDEDHGNSIDLLSSSDG